MGFICQTGKTKDPEQSFRDYPNSCDHTLHLKWLETG